jgi:hypothetical protein
LLCIKALKKALHEAELKIKNPEHYNRYDRRAAENRYQKSVLNRLNNEAGLPQTRDMPAVRVV